MTVLNEIWELILSDRLSLILLIIAGILLVLVLVLLVILLSRKAHNRKVRKQVGNSVMQAEPAQVTHPGQMESPLSEPEPTSAYTSMSESESVPRPEPVLEVEPMHEPASGPEPGLPSEPTQDTVAEPIIALESSGSSLSTHAAILRLFDDTTGQIYETSFTTSVVVGKESSEEAGYLQIPNDKFIGKRQCELSLEANGMKLKDLGASNRTICNGEEVYDDIFVKNGDVLQLGKTKLRIHLMQQG